MTINIISPHASHYLGGMEVVTLQMAKHLAEQGVSVRFFTRKTANKSDVYRQLLKKSSDSLKIIEIPLPKDTPYPDATWPKFYQICCQFGAAAQPYYEKYIDADLFITHLSIDSIFVPNQSKVVLHLHGSPETTDPLMEAAVHIPVATIAHSNSLKKWWADKFSHLNPYIFQNGIDTSYFTGQPESDRPIDILYVGRLMEHKGISDILYAIKPDQRLVIAGNGNAYIPTLQGIIHQRGLTDNVTIYDTPSTATIQQLYRQSKIFACPSRGREGVLTTLLEAGASGCAVVTTSGTGMTDLAKDGVNSLVVSPADVNALSKAFENLLTDSRYRLDLARSLQQEIRNAWSWEYKTTALRKIYNEVL